MSLLQTLSSILSKLKCNRERAITHSNPCSDCMYASSSSQAPWAVLVRILNKGIMLSRPDDDSRPLIISTYLPTTTVPYPCILVLQAPSGLYLGSTIRARQVWQSAQRLRQQIRGSRPYVNRPIRFFVKWLCSMSYHSPVVQVSSHVSVLVLISSNIDIT